MTEETDPKKCVNLEVAMIQAEREMRQVGHIKGCFGYIETGCITKDRKPSCCGYNLACHNYLPYAFIKKINNELR